MGQVPVFNGHVTKFAQLVLSPDEARLRHKYLEALAGHEVEIILRKKRRQRSLDQNAYWHAVPFPMLADFFGDSVEGVKYSLMGEKWGWHRDPITGREVPVKPSTSSMTVEEGKEFQDWLLPWALTEYGVDIPPPEKVAF